MESGRQPRVHRHRKADGVPDGLWRCLCRQTQGRSCSAGSATQQRASSGDACYVDDIYWAARRPAVHDVWWECESCLRRCVRVTLWGMGAREKSDGRAAADGFLLPNHGLGRWRVSDFPSVSIARGRAGGRPTWYNHLWCSPEVLSEERKGREEHGGRIAV